MGINNNNLKEQLEKELQETKKEVDEKLEPLPKFSYDESEVEVQSKTQDKDKLYMFNNIPVNEDVSVNVELVKIHDPVKVNDYGTLKLKDISSGKIIGFPLEVEFNNTGFTYSNKSFEDVAVAINSKLTKQVFLKLIGALRSYIVNNPDYFLKLVIEEDEEEAEIKPSQLRKHPEYDKEKVERFKKNLAINYDNNVISYIKDKSRSLILHEEINVARQVLISGTVMIGEFSFFDEMKGSSGTGKTYVLKTTLDNFIPEDYIKEMNSATFSSLVGNAKKDTKCYDRLILSFGDLGNLNTLKDLEKVFDVLKIVVSEGKYDRELSESEGGNKFGTVHLTLYSKGLALAYTTVLEGTSLDETEQIASRTIGSTPAYKDPKQVNTFSDLLEVEGSPEHFYYNKTVIELQDFKEYLKYLVNLYEDKKENLQVFVPFLKTLEVINEFEPTQVRGVKQLSKLLKTLTFLNYERSHKITKKVKDYKKSTAEETVYKDLTYLIPTVEDVQEFIDITYEGAGLQAYEKNFLLKLKEETYILNETSEELIAMLEEEGKLEDLNPEELATIEDKDEVPISSDSKLEKGLFKNLSTEIINKGTKKEAEVYNMEEVRNVIESTLTIENILYKVSEGLQDKQETDTKLDDYSNYNTRYVPNKEDPITYYDNNPTAINRLLSQYGLNSKNKKLNKNIDSINIGTYRAPIFFTANDLKMFRNSKEYKDIDNPSATLLDLERRGFLKKLEVKKGRANIYYLNKPIIDKVVGEYELTSSDIKEAIKYFDNIKLDPMKGTKSKPLFNNKDLKEVKNNYNKYKINQGSDKK